MQKITKEFAFHFPLKHKIVRNLQIVTEQVGELEIRGMGYFDPGASVLDIFERFAVDIDYVLWKGTDIKPVVEVTGFIEEITEASVRYFAQNFNSSIEKAA
jgi:hypothetical protein